MISNASSIGLAVYIARRAGMPVLPLLQVLLCWQRVVNESKRNDGELERDAGCKPSTLHYYNIRYINVELQCGISAGQPR